MTVQLAAVVLFLALRLSAGGWLLVIYLFSIIGPIVTLVPLFFAIKTARRETLPSGVAAPFVTAAVSLVGAGLLVADFGDSAWGSIPVLGDTLVGSGSALMALDSLGWLFVLGFVGSVVWIFVAVSAAEPAPVTRKGALIIGGVVAAIAAVLVVPPLVQASSNAGNEDLAAARSAAESAGRTLRADLRPAPERMSGVWEVCADSKSAQFVVSMGVSGDVSDVHNQLDDRMESSRWERVDNWSYWHAKTRDGHEVVASQATVAGAKASVAVKSTCVAVGSARARELALELPVKLGE
ncbi:hypothetical protein [Actinokineospora alba]|uniref:hypothetical protein n=1 Tax=Actinokineospora alba TaxID=504798 RepID=UPI00105C735D|nr:hypothetical protein [Actinokineospora alba]